MELPPTEPRHTVTVPLSLDIDQRLNLLHELRSLTAELQENPFVEPAKSITELKGISLRSSSKHIPASYMSLKVSQSSREPAAASITVTDRGAERPLERTYIHRPSVNLWEEWHPSSPEAITFLNNSTLVAALEPRLPEGTVESIMDAPSEGIEVVRLLADFLKRNARTRHYYEHYLAHNVRVDDSEFSRDVDYVLDTTNSRVARSLFVAASLNLDDFGHLRKTYRYNVIEERGSLKSADGTINISAGTNVLKNRLATFGLRDPIRNDPSNGIAIGVQDVRRAYSSK